MADTGIEWFMLHDPEFVHSDACMITDMPEATLQNWANRKLLSGLEGGGKGSRRMYGPLHLASITFARELIAIGFETGLALSVAMGVYMALLKRMKAALKAGKTATECESYVLCAVSFISPDKDNFKHRIEFYDAEGRDGSYSFPLDRGVVFLPAGPLLAKTITAALKLQTARNIERKARTADAEATA